MPFKKSIEIGFANQAETMGAIAASRKFLKGKNTGYKPVIECSPAHTDI